MTMDKWKVIKDVSDILYPGIFQEKLIVCLANKESVDGVRESIKIGRPEAEECDVPSLILKNFPHSVAYWVYKQDPKISELDINLGCIRMLVNYNSIT